MTNPALIDELKTLVEPGKVLTDADSLNAYGKDWTKHFAPAPTAIVFPKTIEQVQAIVRWANAHKVALVPSGGRTGLSAAAVAANGEVVVSFDYMNQILEFNEMDRTAVCQPGVVTAQLQQFAEDKGLYYPVDFASSGSSQLGGNIGTNAGGIKVIRYGMTRNWVAGLKVVTGTGELLELNRDLIKNATGYDMRQLFIGADGIDLERGTTTFNELLGLSRVMAEVAREVIVMVESDKVGRRIPNLELPWSSVHTLITDDRLDSQVAEQICARGVQLILAAAS